MSSNNDSDDEQTDALNRYTGEMTTDLDLQSELDRLTDISGEDEEGDA